MFADWTADWCVTGLMTLQAHGTGTQAMIFLCVPASIASVHFSQHAALSAAGAKRSADCRASFQIITELASETRTCNLVPLLLCWLQKNHCSSGHQHTGCWLT